MGVRVISLVRSSVGLPGTLSLGILRTLLRLGSRFRPSFSLGLLHLSFGRVGIRLPIGTMSGIISSLLFPFTEATAGIDVEHRGTGPMGHARILSEITVSN